MIILLELDWNNLLIFEYKISVLVSKNALNFTVSKNLGFILDYFFLHQYSLLIISEAVTIQFQKLNKLNCIY